MKSGWSEWQIGGGRYSLTGFWPSRYFHFSAPPPPLSLSLSLCRPSHARDQFFLPIGYSGMSKCPCVLGQRKTVANEYCILSTYTISTVSKYVKENLITSHFIYFIVFFIYLFIFTWVTFLCFTLNGSNSALQNISEQ